MIKEVIGKWIVVERVTAIEQMGSTGMVLSNKDVDKMLYQKGVVHKSGLLVNGIKPGDTVLYNKARAFQIPIEGVMYTMITEDAVILTT